MQALFRMLQIGESYWHDPIDPDGEVHVTGLNYTSMSWLGIISDRSALIGDYRRQIVLENIR